MKSHSSIWDLYLKEGFLELPPGKDSQPDFQGKINSEKQKVDDLFECDATKFNDSLNLAKIITSSNVPCINENYTSYTDILWREYIPLKKAEMTISHLENRHIVDTYFYGHAIRVLKALNDLDSSLPRIIEKEYEQFQLHKQKIGKKNVAVIVKTECEIVSNNTKNLLSLLGLASDRHIEKKQVDISAITRVVKPYNDAISEISKIEQDINSLIEAYQSLEIVAKERKTLKELRRPVSKRFGLFRGHILKTCCKLDYIAGIERCENLSKELNYVKENLDELYRKKQDIESRLDTIKDLSNEIKSYAVPLSISQLLKLSRYSDKKYDSTGLIYFEKIEDELKTLSIKNREVIQTIMNKQKSYLLDVQDILSKTLVKSISDFNEVDSMVNIIDSKTRELKEYLSQMDLLGLSMSQSNNLITTSDAQLKGLIESKGAYNQLGKNIQSLEQLERDMNKNDLSEARLNALGSIIQDSKSMPVIPINTLRKQYESEHKEYQNKIELFIDNVITKIDELSSKTPVASMDVLKYYEKINTFRDISQKVKDYKNMIGNYRNSPPQGTGIKYRIGERESKIEEKVVELDPHSIIDMLKTVELPHDTRYWIINDILQGKKNDDGWKGRIDLLHNELDKLKKYDDLPKTDYILGIAKIVDDFYKFGNLGRFASISERNDKCVKSLLHELNEFGNMISLSSRN